MNPCNCIPQQKWPHVVKGARMKSFDMKLFSLYCETSGRKTCTGEYLPKRFRFFFIWQPLKSYLGI